MLNIGVIGYGGRISDVIKMMMDVDEEICIKSVTNVNLEDAKSGIQIRQSNKGKAYEYSSKPISERGL